MYDERTVRPSALTMQVGSGWALDWDSPLFSFLEANRDKISHGQGEVITKVARFRMKDGRQDLLEARHGIDLLLEHYYPSEPNKEDDGCASVVTSHGGRDMIHHSGISPDSPTVSEPST